MIAKRTQGPIGEANSAATRQRRRIEEARRILKPRKVRAGHVPNWLRRKMLKRFGCESGYTDAWSVLQQTLGRLYGGRPRWLDHYGSSKQGDVNVFVAEPYSLTAADLRDVAAFATELGLSVAVGSNSWHYPGATVRIEFRPAEVDPAPLVFDTTGVTVKAEAC